MDGHFLHPILAEIHKPFNTLVTVTIPALAALVVHGASQFYEPPANLVLASALILPPSAVIALKDGWTVNTQDALSALALFLAVFTATLALSMSFYRVFVHRLRRFPGPLSCKLSMWSWLLADWKGTRFQQIQKMHQRWGDHVRIGPREISVADPDALVAIYGPTGPGAKATRGPWYGAQAITPNVYSLQAEPKISDHNRRRRDWDPAFSIKALESYEPNILRNASLLIEQLERLAIMTAAGDGGTLDIKEALLWFGFDVMGELGFGRSFGTLAEAKTSRLVYLVEFGVRLMNVVGNVPYLTAMFRMLPSPLREFDLWLADALDWRIRKAEKREREREVVEKEEADVFSYLLGERGKHHRRLRKPELHQDCMLMVVAGSDTTSNALAFTIFELATKPALVQRLREEIDRLFPDGAAAIADFRKLRDDAPLLNACLNEALRLWPPVPSGLQRLTTVPMVLPQGVTIPANTIISTHCFTMHRDPRNFYKPDDYIPDRWIPSRQ
ncbi:cytochrome P450 [Aspergillus pseudoustus]|uniref:Cytochrome P450 n=1 Tax=Aspergillus pseudoustus TaxID=1810923 RepID=A0ABR4JN35_9EURO